VKLLGSTVGARALLPHRRQQPDTRRDGYHPRDRQRSACRPCARDVTATIRTVFAQTDADQARETWRRVANGSRPRFPRPAQRLDAAEADVPASLAFHLRAPAPAVEQHPLDASEHGKPALRFLRDAPDLGL
jgi:hypothetical protein